jgi:hypothetical protein
LLNHPPVAKQEDTANPDVALLAAIDGASFISASQQYSV